MKIRKLNFYDTKKVVEIHLKSFKVLWENVFYTSITNHA